MKSNDSLSVGFRLKSFFNHYIKNSQSRPQAKRYVEMYLWYDKEPEDTEPIPDLPF